MLFMSHTWTMDELGRDNHKRVLYIGKGLARAGWSVWIDEHNMCGNIDKCMTSAIDGATVVLLCLSRDYFERINENRMSNVQKEWMYVHFRKKTTLPLVMDPSLLNHDSWPSGIVGMYISRDMYVDASHNDVDKITADVSSQISRILQKNNNGLFPEKNRRLILQTPKRRRRRRHIRTSIHI